LQNGRGLFRLSQSLLPIP